jgi:hypothetical protein
LELFPFLSGRAGMGFVRDDTAKITGDAASPSISVAARG